MRLIQLLVVVLMTLTAYASVAMDAGHPAIMEHSHAAVIETADDHPVCCSEGTESSLTCHLIPVLLPATDFQWPTPAACEDVSFGHSLLLTGIELSGHLDPPRAV
jgi:hypothetical protein